MSSYLVPIILTVFTVVWLVAGYLISEWAISERGLRDE